MFNCHIVSLHASCTSCVCVPVQLQPASKREGVLFFNQWTMSAVEGVDAFVQDDSEVQLLLAPLNEVRARSLVSSVDGSSAALSSPILHP